MSDKYLVDTNILMHAHDTSTRVKHQHAKGLVEDVWRERTGVVSTQVLQELCVNVSLGNPPVKYQKVKLEVVAK
jgi:predicted nucleic acid-binding protein